MSGVVSAVGQGIDLLDGGPCALRRRGLWGFFCPHWFQRWIFKTEMY